MYESHKNKKIVVITMAESIVEFLKEYKDTKVFHVQGSFQATNLHVWASKKWQGLDPETPDANIPVLPAYSFGINVSF